MSNIKTEIILTDYNKKLDIYKDDDLSLTLSIAEVRDIEKRKTNKSQYYIIPGTPNNNKIFGHIFDINTYNWVFDINKKANCKLISEGQLILDGFLKLEKIIKRNENEGYDYNYDYEIIVYDSTASFFDNIKQKTLGDLSFSKYNHQLTIDNIVDSFFHTHKEGYTYPLLQKQNSNPDFWRVEDFQPAFFVKTILDDIFLTNGFAYESDFLNSKPFTSLICLNNVKIKNEPLVLNNLRFITQNSGTTQLITSPLNNKYAGDDIFIFKTQEDYKGRLGDFIYGDFAKRVELDNVVFNKGGCWTGNTYIPTEEHIGEISSFINFSYSLTNVTTGLVLTDGNDGKQLQLTISVVEEQDTPRNVRASGDWWFGNERRVFTSTEKIVGEYTINIESPWNGKVFFRDLSLDVGQSISRQIETNFVLPSIQFKKGKKYKIYARSNAMEFTWRRYSTDGFIVALVPGDWLKLDVSINNIKLDHKPEQNDYREGNILYMNSFIKRDVKQIDFFKSIINLFNLYVDKHPTKEKTFIIKTRDDYYADFNEWDWTNKIDLRETELRLLSDLQDRKIEFAYSNLDTGFGKQYRDDVGLNFGNFEVDFQNEYLKETKKIQNIFTIPSTAYSDKLTVAYVPNIIVNNTLNHLFLMYSQPVTYSADTKITIKGRTQEVNLDYYIQALHVDDFNNPNLTLAYNYPEFDSIETNYSTDNGLYNLYWSSYIRQIANSKLLTGYFYLNSEDISKLKLSDKIKIDFNYYIINSIIEYPVNRTDTLTKVELILHNEDFKFIPQPKKTFSLSEIGLLVSKLKEQRTIVDTDTQKENLLRGNYNVTTSQNEVIAGVDNTIVQNQNSMVLGNNNTVQRKYIMASPPDLLGQEEISEEKPDGIIIVGNNNNIHSDDTLLVIGSNVYLQNNEDVIAKIGNYVITTGGAYSEFNLVEPGSDIVYDIDNPFNIHIIDPGEDVVAGQGGEVLINLIDAGEDVIL